MGATQSRHEDAALLLASPKCSVIGSRRMLDPAVKKCPVCSQNFSAFFRKKHYCRRCGGIVCDACSAMRHYKARSGHAFRVCTRCNIVPLVHVVPARVWHLVLCFAGNVAHHRTIQVCRKMQLMVPLPYQLGASWDSFFTEGSFISRGANGSVYKTSLKSDTARGYVAVKVVQKNTIFSLRKWHHIQREVDALAACRHEHVVELVGVFQSPEAVFIVLQYAPGGDLFDWLMSRKAPSESEVRPIAQQLLSTIHYMHEMAGTVHRDIKPENILLEKRVRMGEIPKIRLADFGFARVFPQLASNNTRGRRASGAVSNSSMLQIPQQKATDVSVAATPCGTLGFAAPEIITAYSNRKEAIQRMEEQEMSAQGNNSRSSSANKRAGASPKTPPKPLPNQNHKSSTSGNTNGGEDKHAADASSSDMLSTPASPITPVDNMKKMDIFAAGVTLCILLTGCEPFPCHTSKAHLDAVNSGAKFTGRHWEHVSDEAKAILRRMLHPKALKRPTALECLQSKWLTKNSGAVSGAAGTSRLSANANPNQTGSNAANAAAAGLGDQDDTIRSFQMSLRSLRKNDGHVFVADKAGQVQRICNRIEVVEDTLMEEPSLREETDNLSFATQGGAPGTPPVAPLQPTASTTCTSLGGAGRHTPPVAPLQKGSERPTSNSSVCSSQHRPTSGGVAIHKDPNNNAATVVGSGSFDNDIALE